jgi:cytochrome P450
MHSSQKNFPNIGNGSLLRGHLPEMRKNKYEFFLRHHQHYGEYLKFQAYPGFVYYSFSAPEALQHILVSSRQKYSRGKRWQKIVGDVVGHGLLTDNGERWKNHRQLINPYFHKKKVDGYVQTLAQNTQTLAEHWKATSADAPMNFTDMMLYLTLINAGDTFFGYDIREDATEYSRCMKQCLTYLDTHIDNPLYPPSYVPTPINRQYRQNITKLDYIAHKATKAVIGQPGDTIAKSLTDSNCSDLDVQHQLATLLMAGHDTVATALAWAWYALAKHPDALQNVRDEINSVLRGGVISIDDLNQLTYTRMVVDEVLRLYPSAYAIPRAAEEADEVQGYPVKKGSVIALSIYATHRNPRYWEKPETFYPEHFSKDKKGARPRFAYLPFGAGERVCIGAQFAITEIMVILSTLLQHFTPTLASNRTIQPKALFTTFMEEDVMVNLVPHTAR